MITHECGVAGVYGHSNAAPIARGILLGSQHRGQDAAGITAQYVTGLLSSYKGPGLVADVFPLDMSGLLPGRNAVGHTRYCTTGANTSQNIQPIFSDKYAIVHNGNLTNTDELRKKLGDQNSHEWGTSDTAIIMCLLMRSTEPVFRDAVLETVRQLEGAFNLLFLGNNELIVVRDPWGNRPLVMGTVDGATVFASETFAFDVIGATHDRPVEPGEMIIVNSDGIHPSFPFPHEEPAPCLFEPPYFMRPESQLTGKNETSHSIASIREAAGGLLARKSPVDADIVVPVLQSGRYVASGYSAKSGIPYSEALVKNGIADRVFIKQTEDERSSAADSKHNPIPDLTREKGILLCDDSIVRGTNIKQIVRKLFDAGAREVHVRIMHPRVWSPCFFGIAIPTHEELIAYNKSVDEICECIGATSLVYLETDELVDLINSVLGTKQDFCTGCVSGKYPTLRGKNVVGHFLRGAPPCVTHPVERYTVARN